MVDGEGKQADDIFDSKLLRNKVQDVASKQEHSLPHFGTTVADDPSTSSHLPPTLTHQEHQQTRKESSTEHHADLSQSNRSESPEKVSVEKLSPNGNLKGLIDRGRASSVSSDERSKSPSPSDGGGLAGGEKVVTSTVSEMELLASDSEAYKRSASAGDPMPASAGDPRSSNASSDRRRTSEVDQDSGNSSSSPLTSSSAQHLKPQKEGSSPSATLNSLAASGGGSSFPPSKEPGGYAATIKRVVGTYLHLAERNLAAAVPNPAPSTQSRENAFDRRGSSSPVAAQQTSLDASAAALCEAFTLIDANQHVVSLKSEFQRAQLLRVQLLQRGFADNPPGAAARRPPSARQLLAQWALEQIATAVGALTRTDEQNLRWKWKLEVGLAHLEYLAGLDEDVEDRLSDVLEELRKLIGNVRELI